MKIGLHYHVPFYFDVKSKSWYTPSYFGVFIDGLLNVTEKLIVFGYEAIEVEIKQCNYQLANPIFEFVSLGYHNSIPSRFIKGLTFLKKVNKYLSSIDCLIVRTPTPMIVFCNFLRNSKVSPLIVGEYEQAIRSQRGLKGFFVVILYYLMRKSEKRIASRNLTFTNSKSVLDSFHSYSKNMHLIKTTTIREGDLYKRESIQIGDNVNLLYVGRLDPLKNIEGIIQSIAELNAEGQRNYVLNLVYIENEFARDYKLQLAEFASGLNQFENVIFHGEKSVGYELNSMYHNADIFIIASLSEGFPRVIWEAMINSCPVIATRVGSIPHYLTDHENAILIEPNENRLIKNAIKLLSENLELRKKLVSNALELVKENTIEKQSKILVDIIRSSNRK